MKSRMNLPQLPTIEVMKKRMRRKSPILHLNAIRLLLKKRNTMQNPLSQPMRKRTIRQNLNVPVHVHRTMHGAFTRDKSHGISMLVIAKLVRMMGGTNLHTGSYMGKMAGETEENDLCRDALRDEWGGYKRVFPVASGGVYPAKVHGNLDGYGIDCIVQAGGGVHGHPDGTTAGARAMVQATEAWLKHIDLMEYAKDHKELEVALKFWGC